MSSVEFRNVAKSYAGLPAVRDVSLKIASGELVTLLGPSGCGKTTTLNLVAGLLRPDSGAILVDGRPVEDLPAHKRNTAMVFQGYALFPHLTVAKNVAFGLEMRKVPGSEVARRVDETLALVQLSGMSDRYPRQLSGGQQQRVALARAIAVRPDVLLFDEPLSNLDAKLREEMRSEIRALQRRVGITAIYVTHDQEEALAVSDRVVVMNAGAIEQIGSPHEIYRTPGSLFVAQFIGVANLLPVTIESADADLLGVVDDDGVKFTVRRREGDPSRGRATLMVRPEDIRIGHAETPGDNSIRAEVQQQVFLGPLNALTLRSGSRTIRAHVGDAAARNLTVGSTVSVQWTPQQCLLIDPQG